MAKETQVVKSAPDAVNSTIETWASFGWELVGTPQETNYTTTQRTQETDKHYSSEYTTKTHYFSITFQRDNSMPNYKELVALEAECYAITAPRPSRMFNKFWLIASGIGILCYLIPGVIIIIGRWFWCSNRMKKFHEMIAKRKEVAKRARAFLT